MDAYQITLLEKKLAREIAARKEAERLLESKSLELYKSNTQLKELNKHLEHIVETRTLELFESQKQYKSLVENAIDIIYDCSPSGRFTYANPIAEQLLGYGLDELIGMHYEVLIHPDHRQKIVEHYAQLIAQQEDSNYIEFPVLTKANKMVWLGQTVQFMYENGHLVKVTAIARKIDALIEARKALENSEEKYRSMIEGMELGLLEVDHGGHVMYANDWFLEMTGYSLQELKQTPPDELLLDEEGRVLMKKQSEERKQGQAGVYETRLWRKDGSFLWVAISGTPFYDKQGNVIGSVGMHLDITYQKDLQKELVAAKNQAERAQAAEKEFLANMSHEIRTPLNAIVGLTHLIAESPSTTERKQYIDHVIRATDILHSLISDVLDISKIESGKMELYPSTFNLFKVVEALIKTLQYKAEENATHIAFRYDPELPRFIIADKNGLHQILINLIGNAIKFTHHGEIEVSLHKKEERADHLLIEFKVKDTGEGIPLEEQATIFDRFQQANRGTQTNRQGTGLGLFISKKIVELHQGEINLSSTPGSGSTFTFTLWVQKATATEVTDPTDNASNQLPSHLKLLIAEDDLLNQQYLKGILKKWNLNPQICSNGKEAHDVSERTAFDLILLDVQMPKLNGYETCRAIRSNPDNPNYKTPILALTATALIDERQRVLDCGMNDHLVKPYNPNQLRDYIMRNLQQGLSQKTAIEASRSSLVLPIPNGLDRQAIHDQYGDDAEYALSMVTIFMEQINQELAAARALVKERDVEGLAKWCHKNGPSLKMVGLTSHFTQLKKFQQLFNKQNGTIDQLNLFTLELERITNKLPLLEQLKTSLSNLSHHD